MKAVIKSAITATGLRHLYSQLDKEQLPYELRIAGRANGRRTIYITTDSDSVEHFTDLIKYCDEYE